MSSEEEARLDEGSNKIKTYNAKKIPVNNNTRFNKTFPVFNIIDILFFFNFVSIDKLIPSEINILYLKIPFVKFLQVNFWQSILTGLISHPPNCFIIACYYDYLFKQSLFNRVLSSFLKGDFQWS